MSRWARYQGQDFNADCGVDGIDFCSFHCWVRTVILFTTVVFRSLPKRKLKRAAVLTLKVYYAT